MVTSENYHTLFIKNRQGCFFIHNPGLVEHKVCFVLQATPQWKWLQTVEYIIPTGKHTVVFYVADINSDFGEINRINIRSIISPSCSEDASLFVDNIRLIK